MGRARVLRFPERNAERQCFFVAEALFEKFEGEVATSHFRSAPLATVPIYDVYRRNAQGDLRVATAPLGAGKRAAAQTRAAAARLYK